MNHFAPSLSAASESCFDSAISARTSSDRTA
jgi:hypothetical protein